MLVVLFPWRYPVRVWNLPLAHKLWAGDVPGIVAGLVVDEPDPATVVAALQIPADAVCGTIVCRMVYFLVETIPVRARAAMAPARVAGEMLNPRPGTVTAFALPAILFLVMFPATHFSCPLLW